MLLNTSHDGDFDICKISPLQQMMKKAAELMSNEPNASKEALARIYVSVGNVVAKNKSRLAEALEFCSRGLQTYPALPQGHNSKGAILWQLKRSEEAKVAFEEALHYNPNYDEAYFNLGLIHLERGDKGKAEQLLRKALSINKDHHRARAQLVALTQ